MFVASRRYGCSLWRAIVHDASKFRIGEWLPYAHTFYGTNGESRYKPDVLFNQAWLHHQHRNPHHWQYWLLRKDSGEIIALEMPEKFVREMIADWAGAGKAITGKWEIHKWYFENNHKIILHPTTKQLVETLLLKEC